MSLNRPTHSSSITVLFSSSSVSRDSAAFQRACDSFVDHYGFNHEDLVFRSSYTEAVATHGVDCANDADLLDWWDSWLLCVGDDVPFDAYRADPESFLV